MLTSSLDSVPDDRAEGYSGWVANHLDQVGPGLLSQASLSPAQIPIAGVAAPVATISGEVIHQPDEFAWHPSYFPEIYGGHNGHQRHAEMSFPIAPLEINQIGIPQLPYQMDGRVAAANGVTNQ